MVALNRLTGHSPGFFSVYTLPPNQATSVERQGLQGVSIGSTVATLAEAMRARALDQLERDADRANANLAGPTIGFVVTTIVFLAYPLALRISEAFGG